MNLSCSRCSETKSLECFNRSNSRSPGRLGRHSWCKACQTEDTRVKRYERGRWLAGFKLARGCADCGYRKHPDALQFDHRPGTVKLFALSQASTRPQSVVLDEVAKCDVVCANCHAVRTEQRRNAA